MKTRSYLKRTVLTIAMALTTICANALINGGTITLTVGQTYSVSSDFGGGLVQTGSWTKSNSTFTFISRGNKSCTIQGNQVGTGTLYYDGVAGSYDVNYYWTVNVISSSGGGSSGGGTSGSGISINSTNFPDASFRIYLLSQSYGMDGVLTDAEIKEITSIYVSFLGSIKSLKGIEYFTALTSLWCAGNQLTALDVSKNTALTTLICGNNQLTALDVSKNTALTSLHCFGNQLTALDVSKNTALTTLNCYNNQLTALDVSKNTALTTLICYRNQIKGEAMDQFIKSLRQNMTTNEYRLDIYDNTEGAEGNVCTKKQVEAIKAKGWTPLYYDGSKWQEYEGSEDPPTGIVINATNFPDANFRNYLLSQSYGKDGVLTDAEIKEITSIDVPSKSISSLKGIEYFTALTSLNCPFNQLTSLDVSKNTKLFYLYCNNNHLTSLDVSGVKLTRLNCGNNQLTSLDVSNSTSLQYLYCDDNQLTSLDVSINTRIRQLGCSNNQLTSLDVSNNTIMIYLNCYDNQLTSLDVSNNTALIGLGCYNNLLTSLDVSKNMALTSLKCYNNQIKGKGMDQLINSLPRNTATDEYTLLIYDDTRGDEGNVCTKKQAEAIKAKGWIPQYYDGSTWKEYEGIEISPSSIKLPEIVNIAPYEMVTLVPVIEPDYAVRDVTWKSSDTGVAMVTASGMVLGVKEGIAVISATTTNGLVAECFVIVQTSPDAIKGVQADGEDAPVYRLDGTRVTQPKKGEIYIKNGRKVLQK